MILPFSTQINGKPSYFVERIHSGLIINDLWPEAFDADFAHKGFCMDAFAEKDAKIHTIREDKKGRWKKRTKIDFFINVRQKNMFRFAPVLPVVSTQNIEIKWYGDKESNQIARITIDGKSFACAVWNFGYKDKPHFTGNGFLQFCQNDGFDTIEEFFEYFNKDFTGKLIHWTDKRY